jgi:hypothetical protein
MVAGLRVEIYAGGTWHEAGLVRPGDQPGSMSDNCLGEVPPRRDVLMFRCLGVEGSVVTRSITSADWCTGKDRVVAAAGEELLARLGAGESFERTVWLDSGRSFLVRWTHMAEAG